MSFFEVIPSSMETKPDLLIKDKVKVEDYDSLAQLDLPDIPEDDIFDDVDVKEEESEYVNGDFEGLAFINGVEHFVCPGKWITNVCVGTY